MKRSRRRARPSGDPGVAADVATDTDAATTRSRRGNRYAKLKMPHERDESTHAPAPPNNVTEQSAQDIEQGLKDTDRYGAAGANFDRKERGGT